MAILYSPDDVIIDYFVDWIWNSFALEIKQIQTNMLTSLWMSYNANIHYKTALKHKWTTLQENRGEQLGMEYILFKIKERLFSLNFLPPPSEKGNYLSVTYSMADQNGAVTSMPSAKTQGPGARRTNIIAFEICFRRGVTPHFDKSFFPWAIIYLLKFGAVLLPTHGWSSLLLSQPKDIVRSGQNKGLIIYLSIYDDNSVLPFYWCRWV